MGKTPSQQGNPIYSGGGGSAGLGGLTPNLNLILFTHAIGLAEQLTLNLEALDSMFSEDTLPYAAAITAFVNAVTEDLTLAGDPTIGLTPNPIPGVPYRLWIIQPAAGGPFTVTWGTAISWAGGVAPVLTVTPGKKNLLTFYYINATLGWVGEMSPNIY
jgi:hypothetical protein